MSDKPMAAPGLISYRYKTAFGWIMIGAKNHDDALKQAARSTAKPKKSDLQIWDGKSYVPISTEEEETE